MKSERLLYSRNLSHCCGHQMLLVRSREGGFVSRNCLKCGKPDYVNESQLPDLPCDQCGRQLTISTVDPQGRRSFSYICSNCDRRWVLSEMIPSWSALFGYSGLAAFGDFHET